MDKVSKRDVLEERLCKEFAARGFEQIPTMERSWEDVAAFLFQSTKTKNFMAIECPGLEVAAARDVGEYARLKTELAFLMVPENF